METDTVGLCASRPPQLLPDPAGSERLKSVPSLDSVSDL